MAFEDLLRSLSARTDAEIATLLSSARDRAATIRRESDQRCAERSAAALRDRTRAVTIETERAVAEAVRLERQGELAARVRARDRVLLAARGNLARAGKGSDYLASLPGRLAAAIAVVGDAPARLRCAPALVPVLTRLIAGYPNVRVEPEAGITGGFAVESTDGRVVVDEVLEQRLAADMEALGQLGVRALGDD